MLFGKAYAAVEDEVGGVGAYQTEYGGEKVAAWSQALTPRENHVDARVTVTTPVSKPGAYLVTATMEKGNTTRILHGSDAFSGSVNRR